MQERKSIGIEAIVQLLNTGNVNKDVEVTLFVRGTVIYGSLISAGEYWIEYGKLFADAMSLENPSDYLEQIKAIVESVEERTKRALTSKPEDGSEEPPPVNFAHLKNATVFDGGERIKINSPLRIWLDSVDGFSLGSPDDTNGG